MLGGALSRPAERFPNIFGRSEFLKEYPYFLPCAVPATFALIVWTVTYIFLKEVRIFRLLLLVILISSPQTVRSPASICQLLGFDKARVAASDVPIDESELPLPFRKVLIRPVLVAASNYALLALVEIGFRVLQPLFYSTPIALGGLGLSPPFIGGILSSFGIFNGLLQALFFAKLIRKFGAKTVFIAGIVSIIPSIALFPIANHFARQSTNGLSWWCWSAVGLQVSLSAILSCSYGT